MTVPPLRPATDNLDDAAPLPTRAMQIALLAGASLAFSTAFACATPFTALAAVAVLRIRRGDALTAVTLAWLINQADGFLFMHYPRTWDTFGWGAAIWLAAMAAAVGAEVAIATTMRRLLLAPVCGAFVAAFIAYEGVLMAASLVLPSSPGAFASSVVLRLLTINGGAFVLLISMTALLRVIGSNLPRPTTHGTIGPIRRPVRID